MKKLGCLVVLIALAAAAYLTRGYWLPFIPGRSAGSASTANLPVWQDLTPAGADRARGSLEQLRATRGPVFVNVTPGDLGAYIYQEIMRVPVRAADSAQAAAIGDRLFIRAVVPVTQLGDASSLGPLRMLLGDRERIQMGGTLHVLRPGLAEFRVREIKVRDLSLPQAVIDRLTDQMRPRDRDPAVGSGGLPVRTPDYIGDVRVSNGQITLYKTTAPAPAGARR